MRKARWRKKKDKGERVKAVDSTPAPLITIFIAGLPAFLIVAFFSPSFSASSREKEVEFQ